MRSSIARPKKSRLRGYPLVHVSEEYHMLLWQCQRVERLARALALQDPDTGEIFDSDTAGVLQNMAATLASVRIILEEGLSPEMVASISREQAAFACELRRTERQEARQDRQAKKRRELAAV